MDTKGHQAIKKFPSEDTIFPYQDNQDSRFSNFLALSNQDIAALICGLQEKEEIESLRSQIASVDKEREKEFSLLNEHLVKTIIRVGVLERELKTKKAAPTERLSRTWIRWPLT